MMLVDVSHVYVSEISDGNVNCHKSKISSAFAWKKKYVFFKIDGSCRTTTRKVVRFQAAYFFIQIFEASVRDK